MNRNRMLFLAVVALILSLGVTYLAYRVLQNRVTPPQETFQVAVAAKKLIVGARVTKEDVQMANWPKASPLEGSFTDPNLVIGRGILIPMQINEPILESKLATKEGGAGLMAVIPEGMRALTIQVNAIIGVAGFVVPGARVDLILTAVPPKTVKGARNDEMGSKIVLENLEVLAAGQNVQREVDGKPQMVTDVTLLLTPEQSERVALATGDGRVQLALRNPLDKSIAQPPLVVRSNLYEGPTGVPGDKVAKAEESAKAGETAQKKETPTGSGSAPARRPARPKPQPIPPPPPVVVDTTPPPPPPPRVVVVELIQGIKRTTETFQEKKF